MALRVDSREREVRPEGAVLTREAQGVHGILQASREPLGRLDVPLDRRPQDPRAIPASEETRRARHQREGGQGASLILDGIADGLEPRRIGPAQELEGEMDRVGPAPARCSHGAIEIRPHRCEKTLESLRHLGRDEEPRPRR